MGEGNEDEHGLAEDLVPFMLRHVFDRAAVMEAVGKLDEHDAYVVIQREQDALEVLCLHALLLRLVLVVEYGLDLGESFHDRRYFVTEEVAKVIDGICGILHYIMEQGRYDGFISKTDIAHNDLGHCDRVKYVWLSGASSDAFVSFIGKIECLLDHVQLRQVIAAFAGRFLEVRIVSRNDFMVMRCE